MTASTIPLTSAPRATGTRPAPAAPVIRIFDTVRAADGGPGAGVAGTGAGDTPWDHADTFAPGPPP